MIINNVRLVGGLLAVAVLLAVAGPGRIAKAQDDDDEEEPQENAPQVHAFVMDDIQFDQWVFNGTVNPTGHRARLDSLLELFVEDADRTCKLTETQRKKLLLAGRGDVKRFYDRVEVARKKFKLVKNDQNKLGAIFQEIQPLQLALNAGLFEDDSLLAKTLRTILDKEQSARYRIELDQRRRFRYRARVELAVGRLDDAVGFSDEQRQNLVALILKETPPPRRFGQNDYYYVNYQITKIPEERVKPLFDDRQWRMLNRQLGQGRGMEQFLRSQGFLPAALND